MSMAGNTQTGTKPDLNVNFTTIICTPAGTSLEPSEPVVLNLETPFERGMALIADIGKEARKLAEDDTIVHGTLTLIIALVIFGVGMIAFPIHIPEREFAAGLVLFLTFWLLHIRSFYHEQIFKRLQYLFELNETRLKTFNATVTLTYVEKKKED